MVFQKGSFWGFSVHIISEQTSKDKSILLRRSHPSPCPRNKSVLMARCTHTLKWMHFFTEEATNTAFQKSGDKQSLPFSPPARARGQGLSPNPFHLSYLQWSREGFDLGHSHLDKILQAHGAPCTVACNSGFALPSWEK